MNDPGRKIRWGVLGYARIAREALIPAMQRSRNSEFHALASRDEAHLQDCVARFNVARPYRSYDELLRDPAVDAVYIPLPNSLHHEWTIKAADHGKHVLCEKPIALDAAQCREMIAVCARNRVTLMEAFMYRYTDRTRQVLEVVGSGALGEIKFISSTFRYLLANPASIKLQPELGGGTLYDVGCYPLNFVGMVLDHATGRRSTLETPANVPESVAVECVREHGVDVITSAVLRYPSGVVATLNCGFNAYKRVFSEIIGTKGVLEVPDSFWDPAGILTLETQEGRREIAVAESDRYRSEVEDFADALLAGKPPHLDVAETLRNMLVLDRLFAAI